MVSDYRLQLLGLPDIRTLRDFSRAIHLSEQVLFRLSSCGDQYYKEVSIPKGSGGTRVLAQPSKRLKAVQGWILRNILDHLRSSSSSKGFEKGVSIADNARPHIGASALLVLDIDNFFPTVPANKVFSIFRAVGYNNSISAILTKLCTYKGSLPQGAPTSPRLANLVCIRLDHRIQGFVGKRGIVYTRYADDMTFSGLAPSRVASMRPFIARIVEEEGFRLNEDKTRVLGRARRQEVTGLVLSKDSAGLGAERYKQLRALIHSTCFRKNDANMTLLYKVQGHLAFIKSVDMVRYNRAVAYVKLLRERYSGRRRLIDYLVLPNDEVKSPNVML